MLPNGSAAARALLEPVPIRAPRPTTGTERNREPMKRTRSLLVAIALVVVTLTACVPGTTPAIRIIDGQTWAARFQVEVRPGNVASISLPVDLALTFKQYLNQVSAQASLQYDAGIFRLQSPSLVSVEGRLGLDDHLSLQSSSNALSFDGYFVGNQLVGTVSIAGVVPVTNVTFTRSR